MSTDDVSEYERPCPCGQGRVHTTARSPDHPWARASQTTYTHELRCPECSKIYVVAGDRIVDQVAYGKTQEVKGAISIAAKALMSDPGISLLKQALVAHLDGLGSVAAIHRFLCGAGLDVCSIGTFRKRWGGTQQWVDQNVRYYWDVQEIIAALKADPGSLAPHLAEIDRLANSEPNVPAVMTLAD